MTAVAEAVEVRKFETCPAEHALTGGVIRCARAPHHPGVHVGLIEGVLAAGVNPAYALYQWEP